MVTGYPDESKREFGIAVATLLILGMFEFGMNGCCKPGG